MDKYEFSLNVDFYLSERFESLVLDVYFKSCKTSTLKIVERKAMMYDLHGETYVGYVFISSNFSDFFLLGKYVGQFLL